MLPVVALDDAIGLMVFSISFAIAKVYDTGATITLIAILINPLVEIIVSLAIGLICGIIMTWISKFFKSRANTLGLLALILSPCLMSFLDMNNQTYKIC